MCSAVPSAGKQDAASAVTLCYTRLPILTTSGAVAGSNQSSTLFSTGGTMKSLLTAILAGALLATSPAWADGGHGRHGNKHAEKQWKKEQKHWAKHQRKMHR